MTGGRSSAQRKSGRAATVDPLALQEQDASTSHKSTDISSNPDISVSGESSQPISGLSINTATTQQGAIPDSVLDHQFDDAPYVPPRVTQAELQFSTFAASANFSYPQNHDIHRQYSFVYEGGIKPSDSQHDAESDWSNPSSEASNQQLANGPSVQHVAQYWSQPSPPSRHATYPPYYPAYQGSHRLGLEHVRYGEHTSNTGGSYYRTCSQDSYLEGFLPTETFDVTTTHAPASSQANYTVATPSSYGTPSPLSTSPIDQVPSVSIFPSTSTSLSSTSTTVSATSTSPPTLRFPDAGPYLRQQLGLAPDASIGLHCVPDPPPGERPSTPLPLLIKLAIYGSPSKQLSLQDIYTQLESRFQWFRDHRHDKAWKNSIRHNLSLNKVFRHVARPVTEPGKGNYWQLDMSGGEGYKRARKRRPKNKVPIVSATEDDEEASDVDDDSANSFNPQRVRSSTTPQEDAIDPNLKSRSERQVVGNSRAGPTTRRAGGSQYPSQPPRSQQDALPENVARDTNAHSPAQPAVRFGQPSLGQSSFYSQSRALSAAPSASSFSSAPSSSATTVPTLSQVTRPVQVQRIASYARAAPISQPLTRPPGTEYVAEPEALPVAQRVKASQGSGQPEGKTAQSPSRSSSSSGSSRTWNAPRSRPEAKDR